MQVKEVKREAIQSLTGVRIILAWIVFIAHLIKAPMIQNEQLKYIYGTLYIFIDGFFILTGMLLIYNYYQPDKKINLKTYAWGRIARIYPMFLIFTSVILISAFAKGLLHWDGVSLKTVLYNLTMIKSFWYDYVYTGVPQGWTLTVDLILYALFPLIIWAMRKRKIYGLLMCIPFLCLDPLLTYYSTNNGHPEGFMFRYLFIYLIDLYVGMLFGFLLLKKKTISLPKYFFTTMGMVCTLLFLRFKIPFYELYPPDTMFHTYVEIFVISALCIGPLFYGLATEKTIFSQLLSSKLFLVLGASSYIFYLAHLGFVRNIFTRYVSDNIWLIFIYISIVSILGNKYLEDPLRKIILKKVLKKKSASSIQT